MCKTLLWLTMNSVLAAQAGGPYVSWKTYRTADGLPSDKVFAVTVQGKTAGGGTDVIWAGTDKGLARFDGKNWRTYTTSDGLCHRAVTSVAADAETGDLWIGTMGGACRLSAGRFDTFNQLNSGLANNLVYQVKVIRGKVWLATAAGTARYDPAKDRWSIFTETNTPMHEIWCYALASGFQKVYVGVWGGGVLEYDEWRDTWRDHTDPDREMEIDLFRNDGLNHDVVSTVATGSDGLLWVGTYFGISSYDGRRWKNYYDHDSPLASNFVNYIATQGSVAWICTDRGLNAVDGDEWWTYRRDPRNENAGLIIRHAADGTKQVFRSRGALPHDYVLGVDFQGDDLWVATAQGLAHARWDKKTAPEPVQVPTENTPRPSAPAAEEMLHYGNAIPGFIPYRQFADPYLFFFQRPQLFYGSGRDKHPTALPETVKIGVMAPLDDAPNSDLGKAMLQGIRLALDEANAAGGYRGRPYELVLRKDSGLWGASSNEMVRFAHEDHVLAVIGSISGDNTHIALRAALKLDLPMVNTGTTDPTLTETGIPWIIRCMADDRQQGYALALEIIERLKLKRIAVLRENGRYGRLGIGEFRDAARRMKVPLLAELNFNRGMRNFDRQLSRIERTRPEALVLWAGAADAANIVRAVRARKMNVKIFGTDRMVSKTFLDAAGRDAEGVVAVSTFNPASQDPKWSRFRDAYRTRFQESPDSFAAHGYDGASILLSAVEKAGLNRVKIMDQLRNTKSYDGVTGPIVFDTTLADVGPVWLATVEKGRFVFRPSLLRSAIESPADAPTKKGASGDGKSPTQSPAPQNQKQTSDASQTGTKRSGTASEIVGQAFQPATANRQAGKPAPHSIDVRPYFRVGLRPVNFNGPRPNAVATTDEFVVGAFLPTKTADTNMARSVRRGIELAFQAAPKRFRLVVTDKAAPWGKASTALVDMVFRDQVLAVIGGLDRNSTHLAEQIAVKAGLPVLTPTCTDPSVTSVPIPWIFRCALRSEEISPNVEESSYPVDPRRMAEFSRLFEAAYGEAPDLSAALGYDTARLLIDTISHGATTRTTLRDTLAWRPPFAGVTGPIQFNNVGDRCDGGRASLERVRKARAGRE